MSIVGLVKKNSTIFKHFNFVLHIRIHTCVLFFNSPVHPRTPSPHYPVHSLSSPTPSSSPSIPSSHLSPWPSYYPIAKFFAVCSVAPGRFSYSPPHRTLSFTLGGALTFSSIWVVLCSSVSLTSCSLSITLSWNILNSTFVLSAPSSTVSRTWRRYFMYVYKTVPQHSIDLLYILIMSIVSSYVSVLEYK